MIFVAGIVMSLVVFLYSRTGSTGCYVEVTVNSETTRYRLEQDRVIPIETEWDGYNELVIKDGAVFMQEANCADRICVRHKAITKNGESIICLPHGVYVEVVSNEEKETDN